MIERFDIIIKKIFKITREVENGEIIYMQFLDKSIGTECFYVYSSDKNLNFDSYFVKFTIDNGNSGKYHRNYSIALHQDILTLYTYGTLTMNSDYKLSIDICKFFYDLNITIRYYNEDESIINYNDRIIKRSIAIDKILT